MFGTTGTNDGLCSYIAAGLEVPVLVVVVDEVFYPNVINAEKEFRDDAQLHRLINRDLEALSGFYRRDIIAGKGVCPPGCEGVEDGLCTRTATLSYFSKIVINGPCTPSFWP